MHVQDSGTNTIIPAPIRPVQKVPNPQHCLKITTNKAATEMLEDKKVIMETVLYVSMREQSPASQHDGCKYGTV